MIKNFDDKSAVAECVYAIGESGADPQVFYGKMEGVMHEAKTH